MSIILDLDDEALASLPLKPGERERHMQIELACRFYARDWLSFPISIFNPSPPLQKSGRDARTFR
jgi:hypothetical protein